jgi:hypothetical protein
MLDVVYTAAEVTARLLPGAMLRVAILPHAVHPAIRR